MQENIEAITEDVLPTIPNVIKFYGNELITLNLKRKDVFFIGQTISKYPLDSIAKLVNIIRDTFSKTDDINEVFLNTFIPLTITVDMLFDVHKKLGCEQEFYYSDFNLSIGAVLTETITNLFSTNVELATYLLEYFTGKKNEIEDNKNLLINQYLSKWFY